MPSSSSRLICSCSKNSNKVRSPSRSHPSAKRPLFRSHHSTQQASCKLFFVNFSSHRLSACAAAVNQRRHIASVRIYHFKGANFRNCRVLTTHNSVIAVLISLPIIQHKGGSAMSLQIVYADITKPRSRKNRDSATATLFIIWDTIACPATGEFPNTYPWFVVFPFTLSAAFLNSQ